MSIRFNNRDPVYLQVVRYFKEQMVNGGFEPGEEIPSRREIAHQLKINPNTAQKAYKELEEQCLIHTEGNLPSKITTDQEVLRGVRKELIHEAVEEFIKSVQPIQVPLNELLDLVREKYGPGSKEEKQ